MDRFLRISGLWVCALGLLACSPALNWREVRPLDSGALLMLPCKPVHDTRRVPLAGLTVPMAIWACSAGDVSFAFAHADVGDPARVGTALEGLRDAAVGNVSGAVVSERPLRVEGMTPHPAARLLDLRGRLPDGRPIQERVAVFSKGTRVYQATMFGRALEAEASETFFSGLRLP